MAKKEACKFSRTEGETRRGVMPDAQLRRRGCRHSGRNGKDHIVTT